MKEFIQQFLGTTEVIPLGVSFLWAIVGLIISLGIGVNRRNKGSYATPLAFSWQFFLKDNALRMLTSVLILFAGIIFYQDMNGESINSFKALTFGLCFDQIIAVFKNFSTKARK